MALHGYVSTMSCGCWNSDAQKICGVYPAADLDNGTFVTLVKMNVNDDNFVNGFEYTVAPATASSVNVWLVRTPEVGDTIEEQVNADPRLFYNKAGKPMSLCWMNPHYDHIEVNAEAFADGQLPDGAIGTEVAITTGGKLAVGPATSGKTAFSIAGYHHVSIGAETVPTVILRCENN